MTHQIKELSLLPEKLDPRYAYGLVTLEEYVKSKPLGEGLSDIKEWLCSAYNDTPPYKGAGLFNTHHEGYLPAIRKRVSDGYESTRCRTQIDTWEEMKSLIESIYLNGGYDLEGVIWEIAPPRKPSRPRKDHTVERRTLRVPTEASSLTRAPKSLSERHLQDMNASLEKSVADLIELVSRMKGELSSLGEPHQEFKQRLTLQHLEVQKRLDELHASIHERLTELEEGASSRQETLDRMEFHQGRLYASQEDLSGKITDLQRTVQVLIEKLDQTAEESKASASSPLRFERQPNPAARSLRPIPTLSPGVQARSSEPTLPVGHSLPKMPTSPPPTVEASADIRTEKQAQGEQFTVDPVSENDNQDWRKSFAESFEQESWHRLLVVCMTSKDLRVRVTSTLKERYSEKVDIPANFNPTIHGLDLIKSLMNQL